MDTGLRYAYKPTTKLCHKACLRKAMKDPKSEALISNTTVIASNSLQVSNDQLLLNRQLLMK